MVGSCMQISIPQYSMQHQGGSSTLAVHHTQPFMSLTHILLYGLLGYYSNKQSFNFIWIQEQCHNITCIQLHVAKAHEPTS